MLARFDCDRYNNVVSFRNVHVQRGEIGIRATDMCSTLISCCTEGQAVKASDTNKILLQPQDVGVGLWLESGAIFACPTLCLLCFADVVFDLFPSSRRQLQSI